MTANARAVAQAAGGPAILSLARSASPPGRGKRHARRAWRLGRAVSTRFERLSGHWTADTLPRTPPGFRDETWFLEFAMDRLGVRGLAYLPPNQPSDAGCDSAILDAARSG